MKKRCISLALLLGASFLMVGWTYNDDLAKSVKLGSYTGLTVDRVVTTVTDDDVEYEISSLLDAFTETNEVTDRPAKEGDTVVIDFTGYMDDAELEGGSEEDCELIIGSGEFIDGFEDGIIGMEPNDTKDVTVTFPDEYDYYEDLSGKDAIFRITLKSIYESQVPEFTDAFVKENTEYSNMDEYRKETKKELQENADADSSSVAAYDLLSTAIDNSDIAELPDELVKETAATIEEEAAAFAEQFGITVSDLYGEDYNPEDDAKLMIKEKLVVYAIADKENISVSDKEYEEYAATIWEEYGYDSLEQFEEENNKDDIIYDLLYDKVLDFLSANNEFNDVPEEEYYGDFDDNFEDEEYYSDEDQLMIDDTSLMDELGETALSIESVEDDETE